MKSEKLLYLPPETEVVEICCETVIAGSFTIQQIEEEDEDW